MSVKVNAEKKKITTAIKKLTSNKVKNNFKILELIINKFKKKNKWK